jgi:hypothetical protein
MEIKGYEGQIFRIQYQAQVGYQKHFHFIPKFRFMKENVGKKTTPLFISEAYQAKIL